MPFGACQFLHYAKFMHFGALQYFSLINLTQISAILFLYRNV